MDSLNLRSFEINCGNKAKGFHPEKVMKWSFRKTPIQKTDLLGAIGGGICPSPPFSLFEMIYTKMPTVVSIEHFLYPSTFWITSKGSDDFLGSPRPLNYIVNLVIGVGFRDTGINIDFKAGTCTDLRLREGLNV